jgi:hypothetical protein
VIGQYDIKINVYDRSLTTTAISVCSDDLGWRASSYQHTSTATFGYESMTVQFGGTIDEAALWMDRLLCPVNVSSQDANTIWEGYISQVEYSVGGRTRSVSLDAVANRVTVRYQTYLGTPGVTASASDTTSQALYGIKDTTLSTGLTDLTGANALRAAYLANYANPKQQPSSQLSLGSGEGGAGVAITVTCAGWYATLDFVTLVRSDTSTEATTTQIATLISGVSPGIGAVNGFLATTGIISGTGVTTPRSIAADTTYRAAIEARLALGDTSSQRFAWGVYESRTLVVKQWAGATPNTVGYRARYTTGKIETGGGARVDYWDVRPDAIVVDADLLPIVTPTTAADASDRFYLERVTFAAGADGLSLTMEPEASSGIDARIARMS